MKFKARITLLVLQQQLLDTEASTSYSLLLTDLFDKLGNLF